MLRAVVPVKQLKVYGFMKANLGVSQILNLSEQTFNARNGRTRIVVGKQEGWYGERVSLILAGQRQLIYLACPHGMRLFGFEKQWIDSARG